ncbi:CASP-like protein 4A3 isoform X1 [Ipomoea triloba]|uniref:CASP-like protein 4A3 isoform X1 n=1 Tax=Ipomoea triloba TaxID=35885 RepID=UPI00125D71E7|nr:CASP-like protein 4A3 isoform X1 [Ipomoea triloba]
MEKPAPNSNSNSHSGLQYYQKSHRKQSSHVSMSDNDSTASPIDLFHSPLRYEEQLQESNSKSPTSKAIIAVDKFYSPQRSPSKPSSSEQLSSAPKPPPPPPQLEHRSSSKVYRNRSSVEEAITRVERVGRRADVEEGEVEGEWKSESSADSTPRHVRVSKAALGFRVCEVIFCLISFSVMAADKTQGWSGDSWDRYKEYRYCLALNVVGFVYSGFQGFNLSYLLATNSSSSGLRHQFNFVMDQILAYLLMSASSSAATRVDDWISNWGKDDFTQMASASIAMSFLAFVAFAFSSLASGYCLCNRNTS